MLAEELEASAHKLDVDRESLGIESLDRLESLSLIPNARGAGPPHELARLVVQNAAYEGRAELAEGDMYRAFVEAGKRCWLGYPIC